MFQFGPTPASVSTEASTALRSPRQCHAPVSRLFVRFEGERPHLMATVAVLALCLQDRRHVFGVRRRQTLPCGATADPGSFLCNARGCCGDRVGNQAPNQHAQSQTCEHGPLQRTPPLPALIKASSKDMLETGQSDDSATA